MPGIHDISAELPVTAPLCNMIRWRGRDKYTWNPPPGVERRNSGLRNLRDDTAHGSLVSEPMCINTRMNTHEYARIKINSFAIGLRID